MTHETHSGPKLFFLHLLAVVTLYATAASFIGLVFQLTNIYLPDPLEPWQSEQAPRALRNAVSFLIIMFPVYVGTVQNLNKIYKKEKKTKELHSRKWLIYFTMFVAALMILFSLVNIVNTLLNGEMTLRFIIRLSSVILTAGAILGYYRWDLKQ